MNNVITNANGVKVKVRVYDIGDGQVDRYTIICVSGKDSNGLVYYPQGVGMYVGDYYPYRRHSYNFGKRVKDLASLPKEVIKYIKIITT